MEVLIQRLQDASEGDCRKLLRSHQCWRSELRRGGNYCESSAETKNIDAIKAHIAALRAGGRKA